MKFPTVGLFFSLLACASIAPVSNSNAANETVLHVFGSGNDGNTAGENLIVVNHVLYGTTWFGGSSNNPRCSGYGCGTVFSYDLQTGVETVIHSFTGKGDGAYPNSLINVGGTLYGTTQEDGHLTLCGGRGCGTVFSITPDGTFSTLRKFKGGGAAKDGEFPLSGLLNVNGTLFGTTYQGGAHGAGNVFRIDPSGTPEKTVYSFKGNPDGANPNAGLINVKGTLYGVTENGGFGIGAVFSLNPQTRTEHVLYSFCGGQTCSDGFYPEGNLLNYGGTLFGTTASGGVSTPGYGVVFSITPSGNFHTVYQFQGGSKDGGVPEAGLIAVEHVLYGTTVGGGGTGCGGSGCGTVYSINPSTGAESKIYSFQGGTDGAYPWDSLLYYSGTFYGVTETGGGSGARCPYDQGCGTIFSLTL